MGELELRPAEERYRYDLSEGECMALITKLLAEREPVGDDTIICYKIDGSGDEDREYANVARTTECKVFEAAFGNDPQQMVQEYGTYDEGQSIFFLAVDTEAKRPVGVLRMIHDGPNGFKTLNDIAALKDEPGEYIQKVYQRYGITDTSDCWDIATVAVSPEYQGSSPLLYRAALVASQQADIKHFFSIIDENPFTTMQFLGFPFELLIETGPIPYAGSERSFPLYGDALTFEASIQTQEQRMIVANRARTVARAAFEQIGRGTKDSALQF